MSDEKKVDILIKDDFYLANDRLFRKKEFIKNVSKYYYNDIPFYKLEDGTVIEGKDHVMELGFISSEVFNSLQEKGVIINELQERVDGFEEKLDELESEFEKFVEDPDTLNKERLKQIEESLLELNREQQQLKQDIEDLNKYIDKG